MVANYYDSARWILLESFLSRDFFFFKKRAWIEEISVEITPVKQFTYVDLKEDWRR